MENRQVKLIRNRDPMALLYRKTYQGIAIAIVNSRQTKSDAANITSNHADSNV